MNKVYILLGANLGDPLAQLAAARAALAQQVGTIQQESAIYESEAWGRTDQAPFLNQVLLIETALEAMDILDNTLAIEDQLGRLRKEKWGARIIDIDLLYVNADLIDHPRLQIPHPYIQDRKFTLIPMVELAPSFIHPGLNQSQLELLTSCSDPLSVKKRI